MNPRLRVEVGRQANFEYEIPPTEDEDAIWLGRGAFCKVRIPDGQLSRRHCQFTFEGGQLYVEDMGSRNGTRVNDELIRGKVKLEDGDRITVGNHELKVIFPAASTSKRGVLPELGTQEEEEEAYKEVSQLVGRDFGGCTLEKVVFNGSTSVVFRARDASTGGLLAVKVLKKLGRVTIEDQNRFLRGAKHSAVLRHPNFVRVYKGGRVEDWYYIVMEYVQGVNLEELVARKGGPLDVPTALKVERQLLDALQHAFEQDIVFRAVRPDNVIVCQGLKVKLTDFDLVKPLLARQDAQVTRVMDGSLSVDPSFAAPELIAYPVVADQKATSSAQAPCSTTCWSASRPSARCCRRTS